MSLENHMGMKHLPAHIPTRLNVYVSQKNYAVLVKQKALLSSIYQNVNFIYGSEK